MPKLGPRRVGRGNGEDYGVSVVKRALLGSLCGAALLSAQPALAFVQAGGPSAPPAADPNAPSVTSYPAAFFADFKPQTAMDMVGRLPGFTFDGGSDARGFAGTGGNVIIDGARPPSRTDPLSNILARIPAGAVERIDLVRGGAGGVDMEGKTVIANVIRKRATGVTGAISGTATVNEGWGFFTIGELQLQNRRDKRSIEGSIRLNTDDGHSHNLRLRTAPDGVVLLQTKLNGDNETRGVAATGTYENELAGGSLRLNTKLEGYNDASNFIDRWLFPGGAETGNFKGHRRNGEVGARFERKLWHGFSSELIAFQRLSHIQSQNEYDTPDFTSFTTRDSRTGESILSGKVKAPKWHDLNLEAGLEGTYNFDDEHAGFVLDGEKLNLPGDVSRGKEVRAEGFLTATWTPRPVVTLETSLRYEHSTISADGTAGSSEKTLGFVKPRGVVTWTPNRQHQLVLRVERSVDQLSFDAFSATASFNTGIFGVGNPDVVPPQTWTYEARYEYRFGDKGSVLLGYSHQDQHDVFTRVVVELPDADGNLQTFDVIRNAAEVKWDTISLVANLPLDRLGLKGGILNIKSDWNDTTTHDPITGVVRGVSSVNDNDWSVNFSQSQAGNKWSWNVGASGPQNNTAYAPRSLEYYRSNYRVGLGVNYQPNDKWKLGFGANTINGGGWRTRFILYDLPRNVGQPVYVEETHGPNRTNAYITVRRNI